MNREEFLISGIQQIGVGTTSVLKSWKWYKEMFGIDIKVLEDDTVAERMLRYTGGKPQKRHAAIALNLQGGGGFEIWQYSDREPVPAPFKIAVGDLGIFVAKVKSRNVEALHNELSAKWNNIGPLVKTPDGSPTFFIQDIEGNYFQIVRDSYILIEEKKLSGGMFGAMIGVSDIENALTVYRDILGYDSVVYDKTGIFDDLDFLHGGGEKYRRVLLKWSKPVRGAFSPIFTSGHIELFQALDRKPVKIYKDRYWGDPGFIQICYDVTNMKAFGRFCAEKGFAFTVDSCPDDIKFDMGDASGHFTYIEDPDGTLIEFVETHRVSIVKKLGWYIDLLSRKRDKPLPKILFRAMKLNRVKFND